MALKIHILTGYVNAAGAHRTFCGKFGLEEKLKDEFTDAYNRRFEATTSKVKATCANCLRAAGR